MSHRHDQTVPKQVLWAAGAMMLASLLIAAGARHHNLTHPEPPRPPPLESMTVRFDDRPDGAIAVIDQATQREVVVLPPQSNGFIRGVMRGMFRSRKLEAIGHEAAFQISREADGRLSIVDPATGRRVDLDSFGPSNSAAFAQLLVAGRKVASHD
jgi:putative photosynthetic complex assembly protein